MIMRIHFAPSSCPEIKSIKDCSSGPVAVATSLKVVIREITSRSSIRTVDVQRRCSEVQTVVREDGVEESATTTCAVPVANKGAQQKSRGAVPALRTWSPDSHAKEQERQIV